MFQAEKRNVETIVVPDAEGNPWPGPRGFPVVFEDGKAYFIAAVSKAGRARVLLDPQGEDKGILDKAQESQSAFEAGTCDVSEYISTMERMVAAALALQYSEETIGKLVDAGGLTAQVFPDVLRAVLGVGPGYEVVCKKN